MIGILVASTFIICIVGRSRHAQTSTHALPVSVRTVRPAGTLAFTSIASAVVTASPIERVRCLPLYIEAQQSCAAKHFSHAADLLMHLSRTPGLTANEISFCVSQVNVCRRDAGLAAIPKGQGSEIRNQTAPSKYPTPNTEHLASSDCGPRALAVVYSQLGVIVNIDALRKAAGTTKDGTTMEGLAAAARSLGLKAEGVQTGREALTHLQMPAVSWDSGSHYIAVLALKGGSGDAGTAVIRDPNEDHDSVITQEQLLRRSGGYLLLISR